GHRLSARTTFCSRACCTQHSSVAASGTISLHFSCTVFCMHWDLNGGLLGIGRRGTRTEAPVIMHTGVELTDVVKEVRFLICFGGIRIVTLRCCATTTVREY